MYSREASAVKPEPQEDVSSRLAYKRICEDLTHFPIMPQRRLNTNMPELSSKRARIMNNVRNDSFYLFQLQEDDSYIVLGCNNPSLPHNFSGEKGVITTITHKSINFSVKLIASGSKEQMDRKLHRLETLADLRNSLTTTSNNHNEQLDQIGLSPQYTSPYSTENSSQFNVQQLTEHYRCLYMKMDRIEKLFDSLLKELRHQNRQNTSEIPVCSETASCSSSNEPIYFNGEDLTKIRGNRPSLLGLHVADRLFTTEELVKYRLSPSRQKPGHRSGFPEEFSEKISILKRVVTSRFPDGWTDAKNAINQKGLDLNKKKQFTFEDFPSSSGASVDHNSIYNLSQEYSFHENGDNNTIKLDDNSSQDN